MNESESVETMPAEPGGALPYQGAAVLPKAVTPRPTFQIACWLLLLIAFLQLMAVGVGLAIKMRESDITAQVQTYAGAASKPLPVTPRSLEELLAAVPEGYSITSSTGRSLSIDGSNNFVAEPVMEGGAASQAPLIRNPVVERLVQEAQAAMMDNDMVKAILKLEEAERLDPSEPAVIYHKARAFESMALYVKAADQYQKIQQMGTKAGSYFKIAAKKLTEGMETADTRANLLSIGVINVAKMNDPHGSKGADVNLSILSRPGTPINADDVEVNIYFYDKLTGTGPDEVKKSSFASIIEKSWINRVRNWQNVRNAEGIRIVYKIPGSDQVDEYLLGKRDYYGLVVELVYKGEVVDQRAQPRSLNSIHGKTLSPLDYRLEPRPWIPESGDSLLPPLNNDVLPGYVMPPLPTR